MPSALICSNGNKVSSKFILKSDIGLLRYIRPVKLNDTATLDLNVIVPFGELKGSGDASVLGKASGVADLIVGAPVKFLLDPKTRDAFSVGTFVYLPTGNHDNAKPLNLGENRWIASRRSSDQARSTRGGDAPWPSDPEPRASRGCWSQRAFGCDPCRPVSSTALKHSCSEGRPMPTMTVFGTFSHHVENPSRP